MIQFWSVVSKHRAVEPRPGKRERTRQLILTAATDLLQQQKWADITIEAVAEEAGLVKTTIFNHFNNKAELLDAVTASFVEEMGRNLGEYRTSSEGAVLALHYLRGHAAMTQVLYEYINLETELHGDKRDETYKALAQVFWSIVQKTYRQGRRKPLPEAALVHFLFVQTIFEASGNSGSSPGWLLPYLVLFESYVDGTTTTSGKA